MTCKLMTTSCTLIVRVQYAAGSAVVAEYLRALVLTGKLADYAASASPERGEDHRSMSQLLREMQMQVCVCGCVCVCLCGCVWLCGCVCVCVGGCG